MPPTKPTTSPAEALAIIQLANNQRAQACRAAIEETLLKHACIMVPEIILTGNQITASVRILPRPRAG